MRDYAKIAPTFWTGETGKELRRRGSEGVIVAVYLMSSPHSNMLGLFYQPVLYMAHETGLGIEGASKGLQDCIECGFCSFDPATDMVWVHEMASYQIASELKATDKRCQGIQKDYDALPNCKFLKPFFDRYAEAFHLKKPRGIPSPSEAPPKPGAGAGAGAGDSEPIGSAGKPAAELTKEEIWKAGKSLLLQAGVPKDQCGSFVGKLVKQYSDEIVVEAVRSAVLTTPADPREYLKATCQRMNGERKRNGETADWTRTAL